VIVYGVDNDYIPRPNTDRSEERRLLYVAMTRAQKMLFMTWATRREGPSARLGRENTGRRQSSALLRGGPVESQNGREYIERLIGGSG
jgi:superfamily I DNA/RNA helicase